MRARYALRTLPCSGRAGLAGPPQPRGPRLKWNRAIEARWRRQGEGGHQVFRYSTTQHDGRWLCMRCGLHYVRLCDLRTKRCAAAPANRAAAKAIADALAGGPLTRRKVHAFAKHPSGSRPGAPGARLPSDVVTLDPHAPRPAGPAYPRAQESDPEGQGGMTPEGDPHRVMVAGDPGHRGVLRRASRTPKEFWAEWERNGPRGPRRGPPPARDGANRWESRRPRPRRCPSPGNTRPPGFGT